MESTCSTGLGTRQGSLGLPWFDQLVIPATCVIITVNQGTTAPQRRAPFEPFGKVSLSKTLSS